MLKIEKQKLAGLEVRSEDGELIAKICSDFANTAPGYYIQPIYPTRDRKKDKLFYLNVIVALIALGCSIVTILMQLQK